MSELIMVEATLRRVSALITAEPAARSAPDAAEWQGPAREAYLVLHAGLFGVIDEAIQAVEQAQWRVASLREALHGLG